jgi:hypothetical protein
MSRPEKHIDWLKVDQLLMAGCNGAQIAPHFDMHQETFYDRVRDKHGIGFTEYCAIKRKQGDSLLLAKQYEKALKGDNTLLIWLGKTRLEQKEAINYTHQSPDQENIDHKHKNMLLEHQIVEKDKIIKELEDLNANKPKTESELFRGAPPF